MGIAKLKPSMGSRTGSVLSGLESSSGGKRQTLKTSSFCPQSSSKLTQSIIKDHMVSHYKKIYSAKAAIDASVPKSLLQSVKYKDQIRKEQQRKNGRPHSAFSSLDRDCKPSCFSAQDGERPYLCSRSSVVSSPRFNSSFNAKDVVYPSNSHYACPSSERRYRSPETAFQRKQTSCSLLATRDQWFYKAFQDPVKKTYSGDLLEKHSQHFTPEKPFTPKTLKSEKSSYLSKYRFYRAPQSKSCQDRSNSRLQGEEKPCKSPNEKEYTERLDKPSQEYSTEPEWSDYEVTDTYLSPSQLQEHKIKSADHYFVGSSSGVSPGWKSPVRSLISAEEEELLYIEFISAVTEDILSRGHISDRMLDRVMNQHINMNLHQLDEGKMRYLLEVLRKEFEEPSNVSASSEDHLKNGSAFLDSIFSTLVSGSKPAKTKDVKESITNASPIDDCKLSDGDNPSPVSTPSTSPVRATSPTKQRENEKRRENAAEVVGLMICTDNATDRTTTSQGAAVNVHNESDEHMTVSSDVKKCDGPSKKVEDLETILSETLHLSDNTDSENVAAASEACTNQHDSSDDDF
ncbi:spermatogenesis-associated protein 7 homolog isoform X2 [Cyprinodon tularosa]|uniref:spermatogenesis-associated protein 7 homolog isoform X2 n=1 Tax=Cyprinodon tularosa TaxID=77115 RepID=UPI0018E29128|nr:spermatogenesis-associated protein 7 homolog isoform X2 [Cyprinodon tularosa]